MIRKSFKSIVIFYLQIIVVWIVAWLFFLLLRQYGIDDFSNVQFITLPHKWNLHIIIHTILGIGTGIVYASLELIFEHSYFRKKTYKTLVLIKTICFLLTSYFLLGMMVFTYDKLNSGSLNLESILHWFKSITFFIGLFYLFLISSLISIVRQLNYKCGPGILWSMFMGKYHHPREEKRIFMFLDLKSSTAIAEKIGHIQFSRLIQDCFYDLTEIILSHKAEIYQYVGDEVILTWQVKNGLENNHCLAFYFDFMEKLNAKKAYYKKKYGVHPFFKAGSHLGVVTVAEVGVIKREIAYLGDVVNTAARIQGRCNEYDQGMLISKDLKDEITFDNEFSAKELGIESLRGKEAQVVIFGIEKAYSPARKKKFSKRWMNN